MVLGAGIYKRGEFSSRLHGEKTKEYVAWKGMLGRCYSDPDVTGRSPTYKGCTISENFKDFQFFAHWCNNQTGFRSKGWQLDKDILVQGNKVYSEGTCCFVPKEINLCFKPSNTREVSFHSRNKKYVARCSTIERRVNLGYFTHKADAVAAYITYKGGYLHSVVEKYKLLLGERVVAALLLWKVDGTQTVGDFSDKVQ